MAEQPLWGHLCDAEKLAGDWIVTASSCVEAAYDYMQSPEIEAAEVAPGMLPPGAKKVRRPLF